jgi:3-methyladenine DNA glycosylase AlkD
MKHSASNPLQKALRKKARASKAQVLARFFKTGPGQYGEGDTFIGVTMPEIRSIVRAHGHLLTEAQHLELIHSPVHEDRMAGLLIWCAQSKRADITGKKRIARLALQHRSAINNWDLVDVAIPDLLGPLLFSEDPLVFKTFTRFLKSKNLWERRIALLTTFYSIRQNRFDFTVRACEAVLKDSEDLIHKASGWMLREAGKRDMSVLRSFLERHSGVMPRTMLRYAIEKLPPSERKKWMSR